MKRLVLLAGALAVTTAAHAADETDMKANGEFRVRYFNDMTPSGNKDVPENISDIEGRMKLGFTLKKGEKFQAHVSMLHGTLFGSDKGGASGTLVESGYNTATTNNLLLVNQAYGWWKAGESYSLKAGRFNLDLGAGEFFSSDAWNMVPTTHEGFLAAIDTDFAGIAVALIKDKELTAQAGKDSDPEQHNIILSADVKNTPEALKTANLTLVQISRSENAAAGAANGQHIGVTLGGDMSNVFWKAVAAFQMGVASKVSNVNPALATETKFGGNMFDVTVGYSMPETMGIKVWANYHSDSGDKDGMSNGGTGADDKLETYQALYYDSHKYAGLMDLFGWGNLTYWNVGASMTAADDLEVGLGLYGFSRTKENSLTTTAVTHNRSGNDRYSFETANSLANKSDLGMELDVWASQKYASNFSIDANLGMFMPGSAFKDATVKKEATVMQLMLAGTMMF
ncbi:MAG: alginate export family protein [Bdellovibrionales bacterium]|nr:alginate export family protein [Bdellovibrionales bacterium]